MDPISSLRFTAYPGLRAAQMQRLAEGGMGVAAPNELGQVNGAAGPNALQAPASSGSSFESTLGKMVGEVNDKQVAANNTVAGLVGGDNVSLHQAMIAMEEASVSFQLMIEVRNKLLDSYQK